MKTIAGLITASFAVCIYLMIHYFFYPMDAGTVSVLVVISVISVPVYFGVIKVIDRLLH